MPENIIETQNQTKDVFSNKWKQTNYDSKEFEVSLNRQKKWYLKLYGFKDERELSLYLNQCDLVLDAGAGKCGKAAWFAELSPATMVIAADISNSLYHAVNFYSGLDNLFFIQCDISFMPFFRDNLFDYVSCDQVIHHTAKPYKTFQELVRVTGLNKELSCYVYRRKALPRELLDDYFCEYCRTLTQEQLISLSEQLTELGQLLSSFDSEIEFPDIPLLNIEGGRMTIQRFLYWNFIKCFWNEELGYHNSVMTNYDWYSPSQAFRYSEDEFKGWIDAAKLRQIYFHKEKACYSGRFSKSANKLAHDE